MGCEVVVDFPVYGLAGDSSQRCWLSELPQDNVALPGSVAIDYDHGPSRSTGRDGPGLAVRSTLRRKLSSQLWSVEQEYVWNLLFLMQACTEPWFRTVGERQHWAQAMGAYIQDQAETRGEWSTCRWLMAGVPVVARYLRFAGTWTAYMVDLPEVWLSAFGTTPDPEGLRFDATDGAELGVDLNSPLLWPESLDKSRERALGPQTPQPFRYWPRHPDHERVLSLYPNDSRTRSARRRPEA